MSGTTHEPTTVVHESFGGAIRIFETPRGKEWIYREDAREGDDFTVMVLKYVLPSTPTPLVLLAKIYTNEKDQSAEAAQVPDWRKLLGSLFSTVATVDARETKQTTMSSELPAWEAVIDGIGANPAAPLRIRERRSILSHELFIVGAIGSPELFAAHAETIDKWFESSAFVPVDESK